MKKEMKKKQRKERYILENCNRHKATLSMPLKISCKTIYRSVIMLYFKVIG